ncbi:hypothetical protein HPB47_013515, partial [Ixodes persulcatus]
MVSLTLLIHCRQIRLDGAGAVERRGRCSFLYKELGLCFARRQLELRMQFARSTAATATKAKALDHQGKITTLRPKKIVNRLSAQSTLRTEPFFKVRRKKSGIIAKGCRREENLSSAEHHALCTLNEGDTIQVLPANKDNAIFVLNRCVYKQKVMALLSISAYTTVRKNPTTKIQETVNRTLSIIFKKHRESR